MNAMGHNVRVFIGADMKLRQLVGAVRSCTRDMPMGSSGMADMAEMAALENTLPMMSDGRTARPMGGMFTVIKIREGLCGRRL